MTPPRQPNKDKKGSVPYIFDGVDKFINFRPTSAQTSGEIFYQKKISLAQKNFAFKFLHKSSSCGPKSQETGSSLFLGKKRRNC